ncbi:hypothetical protein VNO77_16472 [Canavalia gladiata]|uniref:Uncharacterized protein n=1 Tax=Canavalia gladiata TaxID=3824 RepID=A0AAN9QS76_CANGL
MSVVIFRKFFFHGGIGAFILTSPRKKQDNYGHLPVICTFCLIMPPMFKLFSCSANCRSDHLVARGLLLPLDAHIIPIHGPDTIIM